MEEKDKREENPNGPISDDNENKIIVNVDSPEESSVDSPDNQEVSQEPTAADQPEAETSAEEPVATEEAEEATPDVSDVAEEPVEEPQTSEETGENSDDSDQANEDSNNAETEESQPEEANSDAAAADDSQSESSEATGETNSDNSEVAAAATAESSTESQPEPEDSKQPEETTGNNESEEHQPVEAQTAGTVVAASEPTEVVVTTDDSHHTAANEESTAEEAVAPTPVPITGGVKNRKRGIIASLIFLLVVGLVASFAYMNLRPEKVNQTITTAPVKKDVPMLEVVAFQTLPQTYYPNIVNDTFQIDIQNQLFETLTKFEKGTKLVPGLADSWTNPDNNTWVFKLKPGVKFHTGKTMDATDVKASIESVKNTDYGKTFASTIKTIEVVDPLTVKIVTDGPDPLLANELTGLYIYDTTSGKKNDPVNGSGPYVLASGNKDAITLEAFDGYHGGHVYTRVVKYLNYTESNKIPVASLQNRSIGLLAVKSDPDFVKKLKGYGYNETNQDSNEVATLMLNTNGDAKTKPLANVKVRQALAEALDVDKIIAVGDAGAQRASQTIPKGIPGYNPNITPTAHSLDNAKKLLKEAGYEKGFSFKFTYFAAPPNPAIAEAIKNQLAKVGVTVNLDPQTDGDKMGGIAFTGKTDMLYIVLNSGLVDGSDVLGMFQQFPYYKSDKFDKLAQEAAREINPAKRVNLLEQMQKIVSDDHADIPLFQRQSFVMAYDPAIVIQRDTIASAIGTYFWQTYAR